MPRIINFFIVIFFVLFFTVEDKVQAHSGEQHTVENYRVEITQDPLSPFVGEKVTIMFILEDDSGKPAERVKGKLVIKEQTIDQYVEKDAVVGEKVIFETEGTTDTSGSVSVDYTFTKEGMYDVEYLWGETESESTGKELSVREPSSYFLPQELGKRVWLFVGLIVVGMIIGASLTFFFMTATLHPHKK